MPQIMPSASPSRNRQATFHGAGTSEKHQRGLGQGDLCQNAQNAAMGGQFGDDLHAHHLGQRIAHHLSDNQSDLVIHAQHRQPREIGDGKRFAKGIHGEINAKGHQPGIDAKGDGRELRDPQSQAL
jgi:hypothetical protein